MAAAMLACRWQHRGGLCSRVSVAGCCARADPVWLGVVGTAARPWVASGPGGVLFAASAQKLSPPEAAGQEEIPAKERKSQLARPISSTRQLAMPGWQSPKLSRRPARDLEWFSKRRVSARGSGLAARCSTGRAEWNAHPWWPALHCWLPLAPDSRRAAHVCAVPWLGSRLTLCRRQVTGCRSSPDPQMSARPISTSTHPVRSLTGPCPLRRRLSWAYRHADLHSSCSRWRAISCVMYR